MDFLPRNQCPSPLFQPCLFQQIRVVNPHPERLALEVEDDSCQVDSNIHGSYSHEHNNDAIRCNPVIDHPSPNPCDKGLETRDGHHQLTRELYSSALEELFLADSHTSL